MLKRFFDDYKYAISWLIASLMVVAIFLSVYLVFLTISVNKTDDSIYGSTMSFTGEGEIVAIPDLANFNFTIEETAKDVVTAQNTASAKNNKAIDFLKTNGIKDEDIKTTAYNVYPKYEWIKDVCESDTICYGGKNELVGYTVSQTTQVKVRDTAKSGELLSGVGKIGISNVSGLSFTIDDEKVLKQQAKESAIEDAKIQAKEISKKLNIKLGDIVGFSEDNYYPEPVNYGMGGDYMIKSAEMSVPNISVGQNTIKSRVYITYKIK